MESTDYTKFTHPKDCTPAVVQIERCYGNDPNRIRLTVPGVQSAMIFDKIRLRAILKDNDCTDGANPLPVKGVLPPAVYGHVIVAGRMLYEEEAKLPYAGKTRPFTLELQAENTQINGSSYATAAELYDALQAVIADCECNCEDDDDDCIAIISSLTFNSESGEYLIETTGSVGNYVRVVVYDDGDILEQSAWVANGAAITLPGFRIGSQTVFELEVSNNQQDVCAAHSIEVQYFTDTDFDGPETYDIAEEFDLPACEGALTYAIAGSSADSAELTGTEITIDNAEPETGTLVTVSCGGQVVSLFYITTDDTVVIPQARFVDMDFSKFFDTGTVDTTGSVGAYVRWAMEQNDGNDPDIVSAWFANTGSNVIALNMAALLIAATTAIKIQVSTDALSVSDEIIVPVKTDDLYLPYPAVDFDYPTNAFYGACGGANSFGQAALNVTTQMGGPINAVSGIVAVDENAVSGQFAAVYRICDGDIDSILFFNTQNAAVRVSTFDFATKEIGATSSLPASGYSLLLQYSDNGIAYGNCQLDDEPYGGGQQTDIYAAGAVSNGGYLRATIARTNVPGLVLIYTDVKRVPSPQISWVNDPGTFDFSFVDGAVDSLHPAFSAFVYKDVVLTITGGTYAGAYNIPNFNSGSTPDVTSLPAGLQALLSPGVNKIGIDEDLWFIEGATQVQLSCKAANKYGAIEITSDMASNIIP